MQRAAIEMQVIGCAGAADLCGVDVFGSKNDARVWANPNLTGPLDGLSVIRSERIEVIDLAAANTDDDCPSVVTVWWTRYGHTVRYEVERRAMRCTKRQFVHELFAAASLTERRRLPYSRFREETERRLNPHELLGRGRASNRQGGDSLKYLAGLNLLGD